MIKNPDNPNPAAVALGRLGGLVKSAAKTKAVRLNGLKPKRIKVCVRCGEPKRHAVAKNGIRGHRNPALDQTCGVWGWKWARP